MITDRLEEIVATYSGATRAERVRTASLALRSMTSYMRLVLCELSWEARQLRYWTILDHPNGRQYQDDWDYQRSIWGTDYSVSTLHMRLSLGRGIAHFPVGQKEWLRQQLCTIGFNRSLLFGPALKKMEDVRQLAKWIDQAKTLQWEPLRRGLVEAFGHARPKGRPFMPLKHALCPTCGRAVRQSRLKDAMTGQAP